MSDRAQLLERVRRAVRHRVPSPGPHPAPDLPGGVEPFAAALRTAGGEVYGPVPAAQLGKALQRRTREAGPGRLVVEPAAADHVASGVYEIARPGLDPHAFHDVAMAIALARLGVAENGAVAVSAHEAPHRSLLFLAEHLTLLLEAERIVPDLHAAFRALPPDALDGSHLTWISGPSKTADIEQTLVLGAHGPRTLTVLLYR